MGYIGSYWGCVGIVEKEMETTSVYRAMLGLCRDNGKENGNN